MVANLTYGHMHEAGDAVTTLTLTQRRDNLPAEVTTFVGRRRELAAVAAAVGKYRLVTLRGAGGVGKTRLALRAAGQAEFDEMEQILRGVLSEAWTLL